KGDLNASIQGNIKISKDLIESSVAQLKEDLKKNHIDCDIRVNVDPSTSQIKITLHKGIDLGIIKLTMTKDGIDTNISLSKVLKTAAFIISPIGTLIANPDRLLANFVRNKLTKDLGLTAIPDPNIKNQFKLIPDLKNNKLIKEVPIGDMKLYLEDIKDNKSSFSLDHDGSINIDLNVKATGSTNPSGIFANDTGHHDSISTVVNGVNRSDKSSHIKLSDTNLALDITDPEIPQMKRQLEALGIKDFKSSGKVSITGVSETVDISPDGKTKVSDKHSGHLSVRDFKIKEGSTDLNLKSTDGDIKFQKQPDGTEVLNINAKNITGQLNPTHSPITVSNLSLNGNITLTQGNNPNIQIDSKNIKADLLNIGGKVDIKKLDVTNSVLDIGTKSGDIMFTSKGGRTNVQKLNINHDDVIIDNVSFTGSVKVEGSGDVKIDGDHILADRVLINKVDIKKVDVTNAAIKISENGDVFFSSKGGRANVNSLVLNEKNVINGISFVGSVKVDKNDVVTVESKHLTLEANFAGTKINLSPAKNASFAGKVVYNPETGITLSGLNGSKNGSLKNLSGSFGKFKVEDLTTETAVILDKKGDLKLVNASKVKLNAEGLQVSGNNLLVTKNDDTLNVSAKNSKLNVTVSSKGSPAKKLASDVVMDGGVSYNTKEKIVTFGKPDQSLKIKSGSIEGVIFNNFAIKGGLQIRENNSITLQGPTEFTGSATFDNTTLANFKSKGNISFDNSKQKVIIIDDQVSLDLKMNGQSQASHINASGLIKITNDGTKTSISTDKATIDGKVGHTNLEKFDFSGNISFDSKTKLLSFDNKDQPFKINSGSVAGVTFKNFEANGAIQMDNNSIIIKSPTSFKGDVSFQDMTLKSFDSKGSITFNNSPDKKSLTLSDNVDLEFILPKQKNTLKISTDGHIDIKQEGDKYILSSTDGTVSGKFGDIDLQNLKFQGKIIYDTKTQQITVEKLNPTTPFSLSGKLGANQFAIDSISDTNNGKLVINKVNNDYKVTADNIQIEGNVAGINFKTIEDGLNGEINIPQNGKPTVKGLDFGLEVEGVKLVSKGDIENKDGEFKIHLSGSFEADKGKLDELITKISSNSSISNNPEMKKKLDSLKQIVNRFQLEKIKYDDLDVSIDKDMNYSVSVTATDLKLNIPEKALSITNQPPGKITLKMDSNNKISLSSDSTKVNANLNGTELKDFNISGQIEFTPATNGKAEKINFASQSGRGQIKALEVSGTIVNQGVSRPVNIKADADVTMTNDKDGMSFEGKNFNLNGMVDGFNFKNLPTENENTANPTYASGKVTLKKDGFVDVSELKFALEFEGITLNNKSGELHSSNGGYELKIAGNISTSVDKVKVLLEKFSANKSSPESVKKSIKDTVEALNKFVAQANVNNNYKNLVIDLDKDFQIKNFKLESTTTVTDAKLKLNSFGIDKIINFDKIEFSSNSEINQAKKFYVKDGNLSFNLNDELKSSITDSIKNLIAENGKIPHAKLKDIKVDISPDGLVTVSGIVNMYKIANVNLGVSIAIKGKELDVSIDKTRLRGFLGLIQSVAQPFTGKAENIITSKLVDAEADKVKVEYNGKGNLIKVDLQSLVSKYVNDQATLNSVEIKNNVVNISYGSTYKPENSSELKNINSFVDKLRASKISDQDVESLLSLPSENLSLVFTKVSIVPDLIKKLGEKNTFNIMKKLADNQSVGNNNKHLTEFINQNQVSDKTLKLLLQSMSKEQYKGLSPEIKSSLTAKLSN
ncbi:MAG: hypothetical protein H7263_17400, partial [Candidatus Sericytochromatia bacterium]|nr:hypothetical protein [Candidatus Sericytochromatia bacterium]